MGTGAAARRRPAQRVVKPSEVRRRELLDAAAELVARDGVAGVSVSDIARAAGTATGNVYRYFPSKEELLAALKAQVVETMLERLAAHFVPDGDWWRSADGLLEAMVDFWLEDRQLHRVVLGELPDATREAFDTSEQRAVDLVAAGLAAGVEQGAIAIEDPELAASLIVHAIFGTIYHAIADDDPPSRDRVLAAVREMVHKMLAVVPD